MDDDYDSILLSQHVNKLIGVQREADHRLGRPMTKHLSGLVGASLATESMVSEMAKAAAQNAAHTGMAWNYLADFGDKKGTPWINSTRAHCVISIVIIVNSVWIGVETDHRPRSGGTPFSESLWAWTVIEILFTIAFLIEFGLRLSVEGLTYFRDSWNCFDVFVLTLSIADTIVLLCIHDDGTRFMTIIRIVRLLRLVRLFRLFRFLSGLWLVLKALGHAMQSLVWVTVLLLITTYTCAIFCTIFIGRRESEDGPEANIVGHRWGTVPKSMLTLFVVMTGEGWDGIMFDAMQTMPFIWVFFIPFVVWSSLVVINMVVGIIVDETLKCRESYEKELQRVADEAVVERLAYTFAMMDTDRDGQISTQELVDGLMSEKVRNQFETLHISYGENVEHLVKVWDENKSGCVDFSEFVAGTMNLMHSDVSKQIMFLRFDLISFGQALAKLTEEVKTAGMSQSPAGVDRARVAAWMDDVKMAQQGPAAAKARAPASPPCHQNCSEIPEIPAQVQSEADTPSHNAWAHENPTSPPLSLYDVQQVCAVESQSLVAKLSSLLQQECKVVRDEIAAQSAQLAKWADGRDICQAPNGVKAVKGLPACDSTVAVTCEEIERLLVGWSEFEPAGHVASNGSPSAMLTTSSARGNAVHEEKRLSAEEVEKLKAKMNMVLAVPSSTPLPAQCGELKRILASLRSADNSTASHNPKVQTSKRQRGADSAADGAKKEPVDVQRKEPAAMATRERVDVQGTEPAAMAAREPVDAQGTEPAAMALPGMLSPAMASMMSCSAAPVASDAASSSTMPAVANQATLAHSENFREMPEQPPTDLS
eukprot:gnl/TRDRNA2_/TRDRNA2_157792_c0_seq1.p1 gnl/TRDRNA2_/TRDRNA2_157792_c0~~gnl/TRDRNA2_/TRDRNA2_157792_c0_seq1.p1  ORF type:complete len:821 (+),score=150.63 gnl/TRDRNA2_/TRDRNA2_157792_c0_seq1:102-2564(+)